MRDLLMLVHRIPYPPNKGDKIRSYNMLCALSKHFNVHVVAFVDDESDWHYEEKLRAQVASLYLEKLTPALAKVRSLTGLLTGQALSIPYYFSDSMQIKINALLQTHRIDTVLCYSSVMAQYVLQDNHLSRFMDFVDVDSDKWAQYARNKSFPMSLVYKREARELALYEQTIAKNFNFSWFVSADELNCYRKQAKSENDRCGWFSNGVDLTYFDPEMKHVPPYESNERVCVFTGAMDYFANVDAVTWFCEYVWPLVRANVGDAKFYIVGSNPGPEVQSLTRYEGVMVTGRVKDVRPYLQYARCAVAPLRIARGIQNKVLEALAMGLPTVCTPAAAEGLTKNALIDGYTSDDPLQFASYCVQCLNAENNANRYRDYVTTHYRWESNLMPLVEALKNSGS